MMPTDGGLGGRGPAVLARPARPALVLGRRDRQHPLLVDGDLLPKPVRGRIEDLV
jgi:hypothetical protein